MAEIYGYIWFSIQWLCSAVSGYFIFKKAGQEGWKSLVPLCGGAICYLLVWEPGYYFVYVILAALFFVFPQIIIFGIAAGILRFIFSYKLAGCFGRGMLYAVGLWLFEPIFRIFLAAGPWEFHRKDEEWTTQEGQKSCGIRPVDGVTNRSKGKTGLKYTAALLLMAGYFFNIYFLITGYVWITAENFPDKNFRKYLRSESYGRDLKLSASELDNIFSIQCNGDGISSLEGIERFPRLQYLECARNKLKSLDLRENGQLRYLYCSENNLEQLELSKSGWMSTLVCSDNNLTALDVSPNDDLYELDCSRNQITELDLSNNERLQYIYCSENAILKLSDPEEGESFVLSKLETSDQMCQVKLTYDSESGMYKSQENVLAPGSLSKGKGVVFIPEKGQFIVEDPYIEPIPFKTRLSYYVRGYSSEEKTAELSGKIKFVVDEG